jgi:hypothetical protein
MEVRKVSVPTTDYGTCLACGAAEHPDGLLEAELEPVLSIAGNEFQGEAKLVLCANCVRGAAAVGGSAPKVESDQLEEELALFRSEIEQLKAEIKDQKARLTVGL